MSVTTNWSRPDQVSRAGAHGSVDRDRVAGLDVARALAVFGMFGVHVGVTDDLQLSPSTWLDIVYCRSSILFAVLAGISIALLSAEPFRSPATTWSSPTRASS